MVKTLVGVEITEESVRAVEVTARGTPAFVRGGAVALPAGAAKDSEVLDGDAVAVALRQLWSRTGITARDVHLGIGNRRILVREFTTKALRPDLLRQALPFQVQDFLPVPAKQAVLDFYPVSEQGGDVTGLLVAAVSETVEQLIATLAKARLRVQSVDLVPFGLARLARVLTPTTTTAMIHIGDHTTSVVIVEAGVPRFVRILPIDLPTAAVHARRVAESGDEPEGPLSPSMQTRAEHRFTMRGIDPAVDDLVSRVRDTVAFHQSRPGSAQVTAAYVSGAGTAVPGVLPGLEQSLDLPIAVARASDVLSVSDGALVGEDLPLDLVSTIGIVSGGAL